LAWRRGDQYRRRSGLVGRGGVGRRHFRSGTGPGGARAHLAGLLLEVALFVGHVAGGRRGEDQLEVGAGGGERDLGVALAARVLEADLALLLGSVPVAGVAHLEYDKFDEIWGLELLRVKHVCKVNTRRPKKYCKQACAEKNQKKETK
jgi:hypothetical protein